MTTTSDRRPAAESALNQRLRNLDRSAEWSMAGCSPWLFRASLNGMLLVLPRSESSLEARTTEKKEAQMRVRPMRPATLAIVMIVLVAFAGGAALGASALVTKAPAFARACLNSTGSL